MSDAAKQSVVPDKVKRCEYSHTWTRSATGSNASTVVCSECGYSPRPETKLWEEANAIFRLRSVLNPSDTVYTILNHVSRSGMNRRISCCIGEGKDVRNITWDVAHALGEPIKNRAGYVQDVGISQGGCGMDMGFNLVYNLSRVLFPNGFPCAGKGCPSSDHSNGDRNYVAHGAVLTSACRHCGAVYTNGQTTCPKCVKPCNVITTADHMHTGDGGYALNHKWL